MFAAATTSRINSKNPFHDDTSRETAGRFGMWLLLLSLGTLFGASLVGFLVIRIQLADVWPTGVVQLPRALWLSTIVLVTSSGSMHLATLAVKRNRRAFLSIMLLITCLLGMAFLASQVHCWLIALEQLQSLWLESESYRFAVTSFYVFSGVHGLHVVGGLLPMAIVTFRAMKGKYNSVHYAGVHSCAMYWHFLDGVWLALFASLTIGI